MLGYTLSLLLLTSVALAVPPPPWQGKQPYLHSDFLLSDSSGGSDAYQNAGQFQHIYLQSWGGCVDYSEYNTIDIKGTYGLTREEMRTGCEILGRVVMGMRNDIFSTLASKIKVGLFTWDDKISIFPETAGLRDKPECTGANRCSGSCAPSCTGDGRKWDETAGSGGGSFLTCVRSNFMCLPSDGYGGGYSVLVHEFGHTVHFNLPYDLKQQVTSAYNDAKYYSTWELSSYAMSNEYEYFASATAVYFNLDRLGGSSGGMSSCGKSYGYCDTESDARSYMQREDPSLYSVLLEVYGSGYSGSTICP